MRRESKEKKGGESYYKISVCTSHSYLTRREGGTWGEKERFFEYVEHGIMFNIFYR